MTDNLKQMIDDLRGKRVKNYTILTFPLDVARANEPVIIAGSYIYVLTLDGTAKIKLNEIIGDDIDLFKYRQIGSPFYRLFLTHTAQATKVLSIAIGVTSEAFSISDFQSPDMAAMASDISDLKKSNAYNYGTQIAKSNEISLGTVIIHTVSAGKVFLLEYWSLQGDTSASGQVRMFVRNVADVDQYVIAKFIVTSTPSVSGSGRIILSIPEGYDICLEATVVAGTHGSGFVKGREI